MVDIILTTPLFQPGNSRGLPVGTAADSSSNVASDEGGASRQRDRQDVQRTEHGTSEVFESSAKNGLPVNLQLIPVTLTPYSPRRW
jgi:hypothetical protein